MATCPPDIEMNSKGYTILLLDTNQQPETLKAILSGIVFLHADCILTDHTMATFLPPLNHAPMLKWWQARLEETMEGSRVIWVVLAKTSSRTTGTKGCEGEGEGKAVQAFSDIPFPTITLDGQEEEVEVAGVVSLSAPTAQTGPFRCLVEKLFVSPFHRRRGFARLLMSALEAKAWEVGKWNIMLDTEVGSEAESVYPRLGYKRGMVIERYGYSPEDGREVDEVWFWKDLRWEREMGEAVRHRNGVANSTIEL